MQKDLINRLSDEKNYSSTYKNNNMDITQYLTAGLLELYAKGEEDNNITGSPTITFFKYVYKANGLFYKDEMILQDISIKWNDNYYLKIPKDIDYIGPLWLKVTIPYFQILENVTTYTTTTTNNANINEILYNNINTFLIISDYMYYIVPNIFLISPNIKYNYSELKFDDIKKYFNSITQISINNDTDVNFISFYPDKYNHHIIPLLLEQSTPFNRWFK